MAKDPKQLAGEPSALETFQKAVIKSGLLDAAQWQAARETAPAEIRNDARALADHLVKTGKLTRFQAGKLLKGISLGLVFGPYHILSPLGKGGMGSVFLARDSRNQLLVAVKVLPPKQAKAKERLVARFRREMEICRRVAHPHLTRTLEVGEQLGINFIAMEFIPGKNLYHLVQEKGPLPVERAARLFSEVAAGLEHAHTMGLIHRDMKPSNIMVMPDDHAKVLDLGLALLEEEGNREPTVLASGAGYLIGTPDYMAPEQAEDPLKVDTRSDIYALGCTLYYSLTGQVPFPGGGALQKMLRHKCDPPVPISKLNPKVPTAFTALVTQMMAKRPEQRYQSAMDVREALLKWGGEPGKVNSDGLARPAAGKPAAEVRPIEPVPAPVPVASPAPPLPQAVPIAAPLASPAPLPPVAKPVSPPASRPAAAAMPRPMALPPPPAAPLPPPPVPVSAPPPVPPAPGKPGPAVPASDPIKPPAAAVPEPAVSTPPAAAVEQPAPEPPQPPRPTPPPAAVRGPDTMRIRRGDEHGAAALQPPPAPAAGPPAGIPFVIDFVLPVLLGSLFLLTVWFLGMMLLLRSAGN